MPSKKYTARYQTVTVTFDKPVRRDVCDSCGKDKHRGEITSTQGHHWIYAYKPTTIRKNPSLALKNRSELCYPCHQIGDALRTLCALSPESLYKVIRVATLMPNDFRRNLIIISKLWLKNQSDRRAKKLLEFREHV